MPASNEISDATKMRQNILRRWIGELSLEETTLCCFFYERTYAFNKTRERISVNAFLNGIRGRNNFYQAGLPIGRSKLMRLLGRLEAKGAIFRRRTKGKVTEYELNPNWREECGDEAPGGYPHGAVDNRCSGNGTDPTGGTRVVPTAGHRTRDMNLRNKEAIVVGERPAAAAPPHQHQKNNVGVSRKRSRKRRSSRGASS